MTLLSVSELREAVDTSLSDDRVQELLDAAEADIDKAAGDATSQTEYASGGAPALVLSRPAGTITSVTEWADTASETVIAADDYRKDGYILHRLITGTNPRYTWGGTLVKVVHAPPDTDAERKRAQVALVRLEMAYSSGITSERIGDYSVGYASLPGGTTYEEAKAQILAGIDALKVG